MLDTEGEEGLGDAFTNPLDSAVRGVSLKEGVIAEQFKRILRKLVCSGALRCRQ